MTYFVLPVSLIVALIRRQRWMDAHAATLTLLVAFYLHYAIYVLLPVVGPVRTTALSPDIRMHIVAQGGRLAHDLRALVGILERTPQDGFPSAHTSITLLVAAVARKHRVRHGTVARIPEVDLDGHADAIVEAEWLACTVVRQDELTRRRAARSIVPSLRSSAAMTRDQANQSPRTRGEVRLL